MDIFISIIFGVIVGWMTFKFLPVKVQERDPREVDVMAHGFFHDEHGDRSSSRLLCFMVVTALLAMAGVKVYQGGPIPSIGWEWIALALGLYLIGKVGQPVADAFMTAIAGRLGVKP